MLSFVRTHISLGTAHHCCAAQTMLRLAATAARTRALSTTTQPWFRAAGEGTLLLRFGNGIDEETNRSVLRRLDALNEKPRGVTDAVPAPLPSIIDMFFCLWPFFPDAPFPMWMDMFFPLCLIFDLKDPS